MSPLTFPIVFKSLSSMLGRRCPLNYLPGRGGTVESTSSSLGVPGGPRGPIHWIYQMRLK